MLRGACFYTDFIKRSICLGTIIAAVPQLRIQANRKLQIACRTLLGLTPLIYPEETICFPPPTDSFRRNRKWVSGKDPLFNRLARNDLPVNKFGNAIGRHVGVPVPLWIDNKNGALHTDSQTAGFGAVTGGWAIRKGQVLLLQIIFERRPGCFALFLGTAAFADA